MIAQKHPNIYGYLKRELQKSYPFLTSNWKKQNNDLDKLTSFIYETQTFDDLTREYEKIKKFVDFHYVVHRWYNYKTSKMTEHIINSFNVCRAEENKKHKTIDLYIFDTPFDVKLTAYPYGFKKCRNDFKSDREYRNALIKWFYYYQSKEQRNHIANRLFIVCKGDSMGDMNYSSKKLKCDFSQMEEKIHRYLTYVKKVGKFNQVHIYEQGTKHSPFSDVIFIQPS